jgi:hypothetical protein
LLCGRHHTEVHLGIWSLFMKDGVPWAKPPVWLDPKRRLIHNRYPGHVQQIRQLGTQLRLNLEQHPPQGEDPPLTDTG